MSPVSADVVSASPHRVVVTGATGFTGTFVVRELIRRLPETTVRCFVRASSDRRRLEQLPVEIAEGDLRDIGSLQTAFAGADALVNVASLGFDWIDALFAAIGSSQLRRGVFVSTTAILTKLPVRSRPLRQRGEEMVRQSGLEWTIVRPTMIYGTPEDRNIARLIRFVQRSPVVPVIAPRALQQPVHVEDVASAIVDCLISPRTIGETYTLSGREPLTFEALVRETVRATGRRAAILRLPLRPAIAMVRAYNAVVAKPRITVEQVLRLQEDKAFDHIAARDAFGFSPRSFAEGVREEVRAMSIAPPG
jgi:uncharacterized protein YbjT (DUF2867 family)